VQLTVELDRPRIGGGFDRDLPPPGIGHPAGGAGAGATLAQQFPDGADALREAVGPDDDQVEEAVVGGDPAPEPDPGGNDLAAVGDQDQRRERLVLRAVDRDPMLHAAQFGQEPEGGGHVGGEAPPLLVGGAGLRHDPRVVPGAAGDGEVVLAIGAGHPAQIERGRMAFDQCARRPHRVGRNAEVAGQEVTRPAGNDAEGNLGPHQRGGGLHGGAVAADDGDQVHLSGHGLFGEAARVAGTAGGPELDAPSRAAEGLGHRLGRDHIGAGRRGVGDQDGPRHAQYSRSQSRSRPTWYLCTESAGWLSATWRNRRLHAGLQPDLPSCGTRR
jgi:hypothetical protein